MDPIKFELLKTVFDYSKDLLVFAVLAYHDDAIDMGIVREK